MKAIALAVLFLTTTLMKAEEVRIVKGGSLHTALILPAGINPFLLDTEQRIVIRSFEPRRLAELSLLSEDGQHGGHVEEIKWSPDNKFLVLTTSSSGGHSPWNFKTYVFSTDHWMFLLLDEVLAPVASKAFEFTDASHLSIETLTSTSGEVEETEKRAVDLAALPWKKK